MRSLSVWLFILCLPALAVLGHDLYHAYGSTGTLDLNHSFEFSALGWLWTTYAKDSYDWAHENISTGVWKGFIAPVITQKAIVVALVPAAFVAILALVMKLLHIGPYQGEVSRMTVDGKKVKHKKTKGYAFKGNDPAKAKMKYKRK